MLASTDPVFVAAWCAGGFDAAELPYFLEASAFPQGEGELRLIEPSWLLPPELRAAGGPRLRDLGLPESPEPPPAEKALPALLERLAARPLVVARDAAGFRARFRRLLPEAEEPRVVDLEALARFLLPRRGDRSLAALARTHLGRPLAGADARSEELRRLAEAMARHHFRRAPALRQLVARCLEDLADDAHGAAADCWDWLEVVRGLLDRPSRYAAGTGGELFEEPLRDGQLVEDLGDAPLEAERALAEIDPHFEREYRARYAGADSLGARLELSEGEECGLPPEDHAVLEAFFDHLPASFAAEAGGARPPERPGQRALAYAVEQAFTEPGYLIADAPTGTGKTLGYLAPAMLWASAHRTRVAVSTYTRALQEQAYFREVPRALELLRRAGLSEERMPRVCLLKGRANYVCGRAIRDAAPQVGESSLVARATWMRLAIHYAEDPTGDLDGFGSDPGLPAGHAQRTLRTAHAMVEQVRAVPRCCEGRAMFRCAAGIRSLRAERSHLVVTNHAFVLSRPETWGHAVFDECDHLHEVTVSVRSFDIELDQVTATVEGLLRGRGRDASPLERLHRLLKRLPPGDLPIRLLDAAEDAPEAARDLDAAAQACTRDLRIYRAYRKEVGDGLSPEERAFLLHDFLESGRGEALATSLAQLKDAVDRLDGALRSAIEELGGLPQRQARKLRWALRKPIDRLGHWREGLELWLGGESGEGDFSEDLLYDAEFEDRRRPLLALKWLLPQKWLGEKYFPTLRSAVLISATARLQASFKPMKGYLGLDILEDRELRPQQRAVHEFAGPPTFDPQAALVCVPQDAPAYAHGGPGAAAWTEYVEEVLLFLAERTRGRVLGLFTNRLLLRRVAERLQRAFTARGIPLLWQGMPGMRKEEIAGRFRSQTESVLLGVDTFWYGVDFPGRTCEYVVVTKLPYGPLDDYLYAQRARMGYGPHRNRIYLPKALAMFRQGCGRLLRRESDRGVVMILDRRVLEKRHGDFLEELPGGFEEFERPEILVDDTDACFQKAFAHMRLGAEIERRGLSADFSALRGLARDAEADGSPSP